jgi:hypothetical protein
MARMGPLPDEAGRLYEHALADEILAEVGRQRLTARSVQLAAGVKPRAWSNYLTARTSHIPTPVVVAICAALKVRPSEMSRRAEDRAASLSAAYDPAAIADAALSELAPQAQADIARVARDLRPKPDDRPNDLGREA